MAKPRVCFISTSAAMYGLLAGDARSGVGGAEVQQSIIASGLRTLGYKPVFIVPETGQPDETEIDGMRILKSPSVRRRIKGLGYLQAMLNLHRVMDKAAADAYYLRCAGPAVGFAAVYCRLKRKPFVCSVASNMDLDSSNPAWLKPRDRWWYLHGLKRATAIVVQSEDQKLLLKETLGRNGMLIRSAFVDAPAESVGGTRDTVLWVGSIRDVKRPELFVDLASHLPGRKFTLVGGTHPSDIPLFDRIRSSAQSLPNLELTGLVPYDEVGRYFDRALVFVNTSQAEGFPNTFLQAWCRGVPVVSTFDVDGLLSKGGLGYYCTSPAQLAESVGSLLDDDAIRESIGERAVEYVNANHSREVVSARYDELICALTDKPSTRIG